MKGLKIEFRAAGSSLALNSPVDDFDAVTQNALVLIGTNKGTARTLADRGTNLLRNGARALIVSDASARHEANFAAVNTLFFSRQHETAQAREKIDEIKLSLKSRDYKSLELEAQFSSTLGRVVGTVASIR